VRFQDSISKSQNQEAMRQSKNRTKKIRNWAIFLVVLGGLVYVFVYSSTRPQVPRPGQEFTILGQEHIAVGAVHEAYNSNPPTSGPHYGTPANWGVYQEELPDEQLIHNLEHGGIWISYKPEIIGDIKTELEVLARKYPLSVVLTPRSGNDFLISLASWGRLENFDTYDEARIIEFIRLNKNRSPEPLAR